MKRQVYIFKNRGKGSMAGLTGAQLFKLVDETRDGSGSGGPANTDELGEGSSNLYFTAARVRAVALTGLSLATGGVISAVDNVVEALGKLQYQISNLGISAISGLATYLGLTRRNLVTPLGEGSDVTGSTSPTVVGVLPVVSAGTVPDNVTLVLDAQVHKENADGLGTLTFYLNTTPDLSGLPQAIGKFDWAAANKALNPVRKMNVVGNTLYVPFSSAVSLITNVGIAQNSYSELTFNRTTTDYYFILVSTSANSSNVVRRKSLNLFIQ